MDHGLEFWKEDSRSPLGRDPTAQLEINRRRAGRRAVAEQYVIELQQAEATQPRSDLQHQLARLGEVQPPHARFGTAPAAAIDPTVPAPSTGLYSKPRGEILIAPNSRSPSRVARGARRDELPSRTFEKQAPARGLWTNGAG